MKDSVFLQSMASRIASSRVQANMTQMQLAHHMGVSQSTVAYWETGDRAVPLHSLPRLAQALNRTTAYLLGEEDAKAAMRRAFEIASLKADLREARGENEDY